MKYLYTYKYILEQLEKAGLPCTYPTYMRYEKMGLLLPADFIVEFDTWDKKLYTQETVELIVDRVQRYKDKRTNKQCSVLKCEKKHYAKGFCVNHYMRRRNAEKRMARL